jgi:DUF4097 and DUF4098 domain-containing protein YvlB
MRPGRTALPRLIALVALATLVGCSLGGVPAVRATDTVERSLELTDAGTPVRVETFNGSIEVTTGSGRQASASIDRRGEGPTRADAEADRDRIDVTFELVDGVAVLRAVYTPSPDSVSGGRGASVRIEVPPGTPTSLETSNGPVTVNGTGAPVEVRTSNGPVDVAGIAGLLRVETSNGPITASTDAVTADLRTSNGPLRFSGALDPGTHRFRTSNGPLELRLPADTAFTLDGTTSNGRTSVGFPLDGASSAEGARGTVGDAAAAATRTVVAETSNGALTVQPR